MNGDQTLILRMMMNLITNAINYGKTNGHIHVILKVENDQIVGEVKDDGIGISVEHPGQNLGAFLSHRQKPFQRKWRYRSRPFYGALDCKPPQWNHSRRKYRRYRNEFYFPISENIRSYRCISNFFLPKRRVHYSM